VSLTSWAHSIVLAWGWRRAAIAFVAGALSALAMAPVDFWPVMFVTFSILVWLLDGASAGRWGGILVAAVTGWWFGFGYFLAGLYWVGYAFLVDAETFGWLLPIAVMGLPAGLALFTALGCALARAVWTPGAVRILALAVALTLVEWLRGHVLTGFPWNTYGYALTGPLVLAQAASLVGIWGLTFLAVALFASPATLADDPIDTRRRWLPLATGLAILLALGIFGGIRLAGNPTSFVSGVHLRLMQPNTPQDDKFNYSAKQKVMDHYVTLSDRSTGPQSTGVKNVTHLIWPEAAFPFFLTHEADAMGQIADLLPEGVVLITGAVRPADTRRGSDQAYNSVYVIDHDGSILTVHDKVHLVPFGEYLPLQALLERIGLQQLTKVAGGYLPGDRRRSYDVPRAPRMLPLVCYEVIFPGQAAPRGDRPGWVLNLTNDGWFGISSGPYQHFRQARVRMIEEGLPLVRAANTGISAVVDPLGRVIRSLPLGAEGVLDAGLPQPIEPTIYVRAGDSPAGLVVAVALIVVIRRRMRG
jgi:apolipoprotein N-acyltransferase